jgi:hypothetical protein
MTSRPTRKSWLIAATLLLLLGLLGGGFLMTSRAATETPAYESLQKEGDFEVRRYPALGLVSTSMPDPEMNGSFMKLFRYIDGANEAGAKVAMTSPVLVERTAGQSTMSFILPQAVNQNGAPKPKAEEVTLQPLPGMVVVSLRFKGRSNDALEKQAEAKLRDWAKQNALAVTGEALFAYYDPPWTPALLRRNEVLLRLKSPPPAKPGTAAQP